MLREVLTPPSISTSQAQKELDFLMDMLRAGLSAKDERKVILAMAWIDIDRWWWLRYLPENALDEYYALCVAYDLK